MEILTYYDLVKFLDNLINKTITQEDINILNNANVNLKSERYIRFIDQLSYVLNHKLKLFFNDLFDKIVDNQLNANSLELELTTYNEQVQSLYKLTDIQLVKNDNKAKFIKSINDNNNKLLEELLDSFDSENDKMIIKNYIVKDGE